MDPVEWLLAMLSDPEHWQNEPIIRVTHAGLREAAESDRGENFPRRPEMGNIDHLAVDLHHAGIAGAERGKLDRRALAARWSREAAG